jgi:hypothetical protein
MTARRRARAAEVETSSNIPADLLAGLDVAIWAPGKSLSEGVIEAHIAFTTARNAWESNNPGQRIPSTAPYSSLEQWPWRKQLPTNATSTERNDQNDKSN